MNKQQSNFVAVVSHEFRTALSGIQGFSELLSEQEWSPQEVKEYATDITTDARRLSRLINEVLDIERMKSGKTTLLCEPVDVNALLIKLGDQMQHMAAKHTLIYHLDDALPLIQGRSGSIHSGCREFPLQRVNIPLLVATFCSAPRRNRRASISASRIRGSELLKRP